MTRGRLPKKGLDDAILVAMARGTVMIFMHNKETLCDFMIISNGHLIFVRVRTAIRIHCTREEIEREFRDPIMQLRYVPGPGPVIRELWVYSRYGIWRFFRIEDTSIMEICQDGTPLKNPFQVVERTVRAVYPRKMGSALVKG